mmetsp:Transcript_40031/g.87361  ORF Transcript_40031/g.87361 Transcript_40031/m.87361 type:complete len:215 (-) Transcript_40031:8-652(-)
MKAPRRTLGARPRKAPASPSSIMSLGYAASVLEYRVESANSRTFTTSSGLDNRAPSDPVALAAAAFTKSPASPSGSAPPDIFITSRTATYNPVLAPVFAISRIIVAVKPGIHIPRRPSDLYSVAKEPRIPVCVAANPSRLTSACIRVLHTSIGFRIALVKALAAPPARTSLVMRAGEASRGGGRKLAATTRPAMAPATAAASCMASVSHRLKHT